ncbi:subtilisin-like protease SBT1.8 [Canna indica]|uniref:Subtilisin-like protease SBT1.8 n=1 Tax=Canna indica TaxID=4628 RepID=A0AAQ3QBN0_9LILI|nr:subtilisin-like protease SBT1.8 [Canna indica]
MDTALQEDDSFAQATNAARLGLPPSVLTLVPSPSRLPQAVTMAKVAVLLFLVFFACAGDLVSCNRTYIVHMNPDCRPLVHPTHADWYAAHLQSLSIDPGRHLLYAYSDIFHGFAAALLPHHLPLLRSSHAVLDLYPDPVYQLHTTRSPQFLGLALDADAASSATALPRPIQAVEAASHDVFIAVLDTGVWPEIPSFSDAGLPEVPSRWRGACEAGVDFSPSLCNRKLIGARSFAKGFRAAAVTAGDGSVLGKPKEYDSPRDQDGHGTHTASTAAGSAVANASLLGYAAGTARGMAIGARVAAYKVCWASGCFGSDILAGMEAAISDGADVLSLSLGGGSTPYYRDTIAIGAFAAIARGIFVSCSAGNSGPGPDTLANGAPWIATVGAGTLDRDFPSTVRIGNGAQYTGVSLYSGKGMGSKLVPAVYGGGSSNASRLCLAGTLDPARVRGKLVFCDRGVSARVEKGAVVKAAGGAGMILANTAANGEELVADSHLLPAVAVGKKEGDKIRQYITTDPNPRGVLSFGGTVLGVRPSPVVAAFSSRGPNPVSPQILKPDFIGPGVNILAGWSGSVGPTGLLKDNRRTHFNIMSGTSMSCPHISGVAALLKAAHPNWSPAAIKSALMTTAYFLDNTKSPLRDAAGGSFATPFSFGAGHVDPQRALSPGLIYDITTDDYIAFLCSLNYTIPHIKTLAKRPNLDCSRRFSHPGNLNYPSFAVAFRRNSRVVKYVREVTNVGPAFSVYQVKVAGPKDVAVTVKPPKLVFKQANQKLKYSVTFVSKKSRKSTDAFGRITWTSKQHKVWSPIAYTWTM